MGVGMVVALVAVRSLILLRDPGQFDGLRLSFDAFALVLMVLLVLLVWRLDPWEDAARRRWLAAALGCSTLASTLDVALQFLPELDGLVLEARAGVATIGLCALVVGRRGRSGAGAPSWRYLSGLLALGAAAVAVVIHVATQLTQVANIGDGGIDPTTVAALQVWGMMAAVVAAVAGGLRALTTRGEDLEEVEHLHERAMGSWVADLRDRDHELRNAVMGVEGTALTLLAHYDRLSETDRAALGESLRRTLKNLREVVVGGSRSQTEDVTDVGALLERVGDEARRSGVVVSVSTPEPMWVSCWESELEGVIRELVTNACEHGVVGGDVEVSLTARRVGSTALITVEDRGEGVPAAWREQVFRRGVTRGDGEGLGLYVVRATVRGMGGTVWLEPRTGGGTRAVVALGQLAEGDQLTPAPPVDVAGSGSP